jgi:ABC-type transporter Mla subunit MlaD
VEQEAELKR